MVAYSFKRQFVEPIRQGTKTQTIRADRKRHARAGESLQLYSGMRTKDCFLIGIATCTGVQPITLDFAEAFVAIGVAGIWDRHDLDYFARSDGFADWQRMRAFWAKEHASLTRWSGLLIRWNRFVRIHNAACG